MTLSDREKFIFFLTKLSCLRDHASRAHARDIISKNFKDVIQENRMHETPTVTFDESQKIIEDIIELQNHYHTIHQFLEKRMATQ